MCGAGEWVTANETVREWNARRLEHLEACGYATVSDIRSRAVRIYAAFGSKDVAKVTSSDVEDLRELLDREIRAGVISWKTASHVWSDVRCMFRDAVSSKERALRARRDDPTDDIRPPDKGPEKGKVVLFPDEAAALMSCTDVPAPYRVLYGVAIYTGLRAGELEALEVGDVDLEHGLLHIDKAVNRKTGEVESTKTEMTADITIEATLAPLLAALTHERGAKAHAHDRLLWLPADEDRASNLRKHLIIAGVGRAALHASDARNVNLRFHDLRSTHLTWRACRGDSPAFIQAVARHTTFQQTTTYVNRATLLRGIGDVFARLPPELVESAASFGPGFGPGRFHAPNLRKHHRFLATPTGIEPVLPT
jgi:integrase